MASQWVDCDRSVIRQRYDRIAELIPFFDWLFFLPKDLRARAVTQLGVGRGDSVLEIGCGTGRNFANLRNAVGPTGRIYGVDISPGMLHKAKLLCDANGWGNIELSECDAADYKAPTPLDGVLFSLSYNTMPHHRTVLNRVWEQLRPGGCLVIMDAKLPPGFAGQLILPFSLWLMKHTMLGNPLVRPWEELAEITELFEMKERLLGAYYICRGTKPLSGAKASDRNVSNDDTVPDIDHRIAAE